MVNDTVSTSAKGVDAVFKHFGTLLRHAAPGYVFLLSFHCSIGKMPEKDNLKAELLIGLILGILLYAIYKATLSRRFHTWSDTVLAAEYAPRDPTGKKPHYLLGYATKAERLHELEVQRWLRRRTEHRGLATIQREFDQWGTSSVFLACSGMTIILAGISAILWMRFGHGSSSWEHGVYTQPVICCVLGFLVLCIGNRCGRALDKREWLMLREAKHILNPVTAKTANTKSSTSQKKAKSKKPAS